MGMHTTWVRMVLICAIALPAALAAMYIARSQAEPVVITAKEKLAQPSENAVAKVSQMDKISEALRGE